MIVPYRRLVAIFLAVCLLVAGNGIVFAPRADAALLHNRSLYIKDPTPAGITRHQFTFDYASSSTPVGSVQFQYCLDPLEVDPCDAPHGMDISQAQFTDQSGTTGFSVQTAESSRIVLTRTAATPQASGQYTFDNVKNPDGLPASFYVRISTYPTTDASGIRTDFGTVVNSTVQAVMVNSEVPPILKFCVGITIDGDCSSADGNIVDLGDLTTARVSSGTSQMQAATNAPFGLAITVYGNTMTSGNNSIPALAIPTPSAPGNAQFGLNLRRNTDPAIGTEPSGIGVSNPTAAYNTPNRYAFTPGSTIATSPVATDVRTLTASYIANVPPGQAAGVYTATLTYICTAAF